MNDRYPLYPTCTYTWTNIGPSLKKTLPQAILHRGSACLKNFDELN